MTKKATNFFEEQKISYCCNAKKATFVEFTEKLLICLKKNLKKQWESLFVSDKQWHIEITVHIAR